MNSKPIPIPWEASPSDTLGKALHFLHMDRVFYCRSELRGLWGAHIPPTSGQLWFHAVLEGQGWLSINDNHSKSLLLREGTMVLIPHGQGHRLRSGKGASTPNVLELEREKVNDHYEILRHGKGERRTTMICGALSYDHPAARNLIDALPDTLLLNTRHAPHMEWMRSTFQLMAAESKNCRPGSEAVVTRLGDILVIQAIRAWIEADSGTLTGWLGALKDRRIGHAIALIHRAPHQEWTVASLASKVAMSRSAFAARFTELVGESAMRYVTRWRMYLALESLREKGMSVAEVASQLGYLSEASFSRAFKRVMSISPGAARKIHPSDIGE